MDLRSQVNNMAHFYPHPYLYSMLVHQNVPTKFSHKGKQDAIVKLCFIKGYIFIVYIITILNII